MVLTILIVFVSLISLIVLHEFGHFILAKKFRVRVEEFGIGLPPRLFGKKIGETLYSLNLLPFGAFVKIYGEERKTVDYRSFSEKPIWQRALIILGGVITFWIISVILLSIVMSLGVPRVVEDEANHNLIDPRVQIVGVIPNSPAEIVGLKSGDNILQLKKEDQILKTDKVKGVIEFTQAHKGEEITLTIRRGKEIFDLVLIPRISPPKGEGAMGIALVRTAIKYYPWYRAPLEGISATYNLTIIVIQGWVQAIGNAIKGLPTGVQLMGPVGIFSLVTQVSQLGTVYFLQFIAVISIYLALFNILPIPVVDGGKLLFLGIEAIRKKPIPQKIEQKITAFFFALLIILSIWVMIKDIARLF